jgi:hypothetical protein
VHGGYVTAPYLPEQQYLAFPSYIPLQKEVILEAK